ncbi:hypothetical protein AGMMS4957_07520 [Bacteroidia bacterium]|nr:hypothetical protein AGMMS4957_07520 [Bacteroidia bacterium]
MKKAKKAVAKMPEKSLPFFAMGALFIALSLFLSFAPGVTRGWGLNYIAGFDTWVIALFYLCLLCFLLPSTNQYLVKQITAFSRQSIIATLRKHRYLLFAVLSIAAIGVFRLLKIKYVIGGDLLNRIPGVEHGEFAPEEYLSMWVLHHLYVWLHELFDFTGFQAVQLADYIIGGLFVFFALCTANLLGNTFLKKVAAFIISTLSCAILLQFCGYNEMYAFALLFLQLYFFTSLLCLKDKIHLFVPAVILLTGIAFHMMLACMLPSLVLLCYGKGLWKYPLFRNKITIIILILLSLPFLYFAFQNVLLPRMLPLEAPEGSLSLFSIAHVKEFSNSQLLGGGTGFYLAHATHL